MADRAGGYSTIAVDVDAPRPKPAPRRRLPGPWWLHTAIGSVAVVLCGWVLYAGTAVLGSLPSPDVGVAAGLGLASRLLLLTYGAPVNIGGQEVSLVPLLMTMALVVLGQPGVAAVARQLAADEATCDDTGKLWVDGTRLVARVAGVYAVTQAVCLLLLGWAVGEPVSALIGGLGGLIVGAVTALWGASRAIHHDPRRSWPGWLKQVPAALGAAVLICLATGAAVLAVALIQQRDQVAAISGALGADGLGAVLLALLQLLYLPNLALWGTAWSLGAGITLGDGSLVNLNVTDLGFLPAFPVLGAVPEPGLAPETTLWWLAGGVLAGVVAALLVVGSRPRERFDRTGLVGALSGIAAGLLVVLLASMAGGGLGTGRLTQLGPVAGDLFVVAPSVLGLAGLVTGVVIGLIRRPAASTAKPATTAPEAGPEA